MSMCFVLSPVFLLFESHIASTLSTCTVIGNSTVMFMVCNSCTMNFSSLTTSESAIYSASVVDSTTLFIPLLLQAIGNPQKYITYPYTLILVSLSLAKSLSLSAFCTHFLMLLISLNFRPKYFCGQYKPDEFIHFFQVCWSWCIHSL